MPTISERNPTNSTTEIQVCQTCRNTITDGTARTVPTITDGTARTAANQTHCEECYHDLFTSCDHCNSAVSRDETTILNNETIYCTSCIQTQTCPCSDCSVIVMRNSHNGYTTERPLCYNCRRSYRTCQTCGEYFNSNSMRQCDCGAQYCVDCHPTRQCCPLKNVNYYSDKLIQLGQSGIADYHPKIDWDFRAHNIDLPETPYIGIELEVENEGGLDNTARLVGSHLKGHAICTHDGSLRYGTEIVFAPHKVRELRSKDIKKFLETLQSFGTTSLEGARCGMHIHIERISWFNRKSKFLKVQQVKIGKYQSCSSGADLYQMFFNLFNIDIKKLSLRTQGQIDRYCAFSRTRDSKYVAVNISPKKTIEVRIWRGTTDPKMFKVYVQFTLAVLDFLKVHSAVLVLKEKASTLAEHFQVWLKQQGEYQVLYKHLAENNLMGCKKEVKKTKVKTKKKGTSNVRNRSQTNRSSDRPGYRPQNVGS